MLITVFTPTYNRAHLLPRVYESLCKQTFRDFEWVIVDDGSVDDTKSLSLSLIPEQSSPTRSLSKREGNFVPVRYFYQVNGGKHRAINRGVKEAKGELFFIVDSDDWLPEDALEIVARRYDEIRHDKTFAGVAGFDITPDGKRIGRGYDFDVLDCNILDFWYKYQVCGDMKEVFRTDVLREIPFPEIENELFCPEELEWVRIAKKYKLRYFNEDIYVADYQANGLSANIIRIRMNSPIAAIMTYAISLPLGIPFLRKIRYAINYYRFKMNIHGQNYKDEFRKYRVDDISPIWWWTKPFGWIMHRYDCKRM